MSTTHALQFGRVPAIIAAAAVVLGSIQFAPPAASAEPTETVLTPNPAITGPAFEGWGTSLVWMANATGSYPDALRDELIDHVFGEDGLRLNIARYNVGGGNASDVSDYLRPGGAVPGWWNPVAGLSDETGPITSDHADRDRYLATWTGEEASDYDFAADAAQLAWVDLIKDRITTWEAFSNSPPYFMTESGYVSGGFDPNAEQIKPEAVEKFATYLKTVVEQVEDAHGISFDTIDPLNEPNTDYWGTTLDGSGNPYAGRQEGAHAGPAMQSQVLTALAAELAEAGTTTGATVSGPDETNPGRFVTDWEGWTSEAKQAVEQLNVHTYSTGDRLRARDIAKAAGAPLWMSEVEGNWGGDGWNPASMENGLGIAQHITGDLRELDPSAWVLWQPVEDLYNMEKAERKNWGSIFVDFDCNAEGDSERRLADGDADPSCRVLTNTKFDAIRNFTHYIEPGDRIVPTNDERTTSAVKADGSGVVLVHTNTGDEQTVRVDLSRFAEVGPGATVTPITTTESPADAPSANAMVSGQPVPVDPSTKSAELTLPARSVTTLVVTQASGVAADAPALRDGSSFRLVGVQSGKPITANDGSPATVLGGAADPLADDVQLWTATRLTEGDGTARDRYALRLADGRTLVAVDGRTDLRILTDEEVTADASAQWLASSTDGTSFSLVNAAAEQVLDVAGQATSTGASVGLWPSNGGTNQAFTLVEPSDGPTDFPDASLAALVEHDFALYAVNSGAVITDATAKGDRMGLYQSRSDQPFGVDPTTGGSWGYLATGTSNPVPGGDGSSLYRDHTVIVDEEPGGASLGDREVAYAFDLPNGDYDVTIGADLPLYWGPRDVELRAEGRTVETTTFTELARERSFPVSVADGRLELSVHSVPGRTDDRDDPAVGWVLVKARPAWTPSVLESTLAVTEMPDETVIEAGRMELEAARAEARSLVDASSTDAEAIESAYQRLRHARDALVSEDSASSSFLPGQEWRDDFGRVIQAHGGQVVTSTDAEGETIYYLYGEDRTNGYHSSPGVHVYSSYDLYNWTDRGVALRAMATPGQFEEDPYFADLYAGYTDEQRAAVYRDLGTVQHDPAVNPAILERPKVIHNERTGKWVMWLHADGPSSWSNAQYAKANAGVAVSDSPFGPFRYLESDRLHHAPADDPTNQAPNNPGMARDMNLFVDQDGTGYIIYSSEENETMFISKLNDEYTDLSASPEDAVEGVDYTRAFVGESRESPAIFRYQDRYYLITSGTTGWAPNAAKYGTATDILGDWTLHGNPFAGDVAHDSYNSQPSSVIPVDAAEGEFIYMGDRWNYGTDLANAQMVWLPIHMGEGGKSITVATSPEWRLEDLVGHGAWEVSGVPSTLDVGEVFDVPTVTVTQNGIASEQPVTWQLSGSTDVPGVITALGTLPEAGDRTFTRSIPVVPDGVRYAVNAGGQRTADWTALFQAAQGQGGILQSRPEQPYGVDSGTFTTWGYEDEGSATVGDADGTMFSTLRYATGRRDLTYRFGGLEPGTYTVYAGYSDPWPWDDRGARVTVNGVVMEEDHDYDEVDQTAAYDGAAVSEDGTLEFTLSPTRAHDVQLSWLIVADAPAPDLEAPTIAVSTEPGAPDGAEGWFRAPVNVVAVAEDPSGVASIETRSGASAWATYTGAVAVGEGTIPFDVRATDAVGNVSAVQTRTVRRDATAPVTGFASTASPGAVTVTLTARDEVSGVSGVRYRVDGGAWGSYQAPISIAGTGTHTLEFSATDRAGNAEAVQTRQVAVTVDRTAPTLTVITDPPSPDGAKGWYRSPVTVSASATDASGISSLDVRIDGGSWSPYRAPIVADSGRTTVEFRAVDVAGNQTRKSVTIKVDTTAPNTTASTIELFGSTLAVTLSARDPGSGVDRISYRVDGGAWRTYSAPILMVGGRARVLEYHAVDEAGNVGQTRSLAIRR